MCRSFHPLQLVRLWRLRIYYRLAATGPESDPPKPSSRSLRYSIVIISATVRARDDISVLSCRGRIVLQQLHGCFLDFVNIGELGAPKSQKWRKSEFATFSIVDISVTISRLDKVPGAFRRDIQA